MDYNWAEIFKTKTTKELYEIYRGESFLPVSAIPFAKKELENRDFDLNDTKDIFFEQQYNVLVEEASEINLFLQKNQNSSLKISLVISSIVLVPFFYIFG